MTDDFSAKRPWQDKGSLRETEGGVAWEFVWRTDLPLLSV